MNLEEFKKIAKLIRSDERYDIYDLEIGDVKFCLTELHAEQHTKGHSHPYSETYLFLDDATLMLGKLDLIAVNKGTTIAIPPYMFHRVYAPKDSPTSLLSLFIGGRNLATYQEESLYIQNDIQV